MWRLLHHEEHEGHEDLFTVLMGGVRSCGMRVFGDVDS